MRAWRSPSWLFAALLLGGCYNPDLVVARFTCEPSRGVTDCPEGQSCVRGYCQPPEAIEDGDLTTPVVLDMTSPRPADMTSPRPADMTSPPADMTSTQPGCGASTGGTSLNADVSVVACRGAFAAGAYAALCGSGYHVCKESDATPLKALSGTCDNVPGGGFFAAALPASYKDSDPMKGLKCNNDQDLKALVGCGKPRDGQGGGPMGCSGLSYYMLCGRYGWTCTGGLTNTTVYTGEQNGGVLCCKN